MPPKNPLLVQFSELQHSKHVQDLWAEEHLGATGQPLRHRNWELHGTCLRNEDIMRFGVHGVNFPFPAQCPKSFLALNA